MIQPASIYRDMPAVLGDDEVTDTSHMSLTADLDPVDMHVTAHITTEGRPFVVTLTFAGGEQVKLEYVEGHDQQILGSLHTVELPPEFDGVRLPLDEWTGRIAEAIGGRGTRWATSRTPP